MSPALRDYLAYHARTIHVAREISPTLDLQGSNHTEAHAEIACRVREAFLFLKPDTRLFRQPLSQQEEKIYNNNTWKNNPSQITHFL